MRWLVVDRDTFIWGWKRYASKGFHPLLSLQESWLRIEKAWSVYLAFTATFTLGWVSQEKYEANAEETITIGVEERQVRVALKESRWNMNPNDTYIMRYRNDFFNIQLIKNRIGWFWSSIIQVIDVINLKILGSVSFISLNTKGISNI